MRAGREPPGNAACSGIVKSHAIDDRQIRLETEEAGPRIAGLRKRCNGSAFDETETLVQHPASMTHATYSADERKRHGISDSLLRLSVGLENIEDLMADIAQALDHIHASKG